MYVYKKKTLRILFTIVDAIGGALFFCLKRRKPDTSAIKKILVIRLDHIGDLVNASVVFAPLRRYFPGSTIEILCSPAGKELYGCNPDIDKINVFKAPWFSRDKTGFKETLRQFFLLVKIIREGEYGLCFDLRGDFRHILAMFFSGVRCRVGYGITGGGFLLTREVPYAGLVHEQVRNLRLLGAVGVKEEEPKVDIRADGNGEKKARNIAIGYCSGEQYCIIHMFPGHPTKRWSLDRFADIIKYIKDEKRLMPVLVGAEADRKYMEGFRSRPGSDYIDVIGHADLGTVYHLCRCARMFIGVDSGPAHIAAASGVRCIVLFSGVNAPEEWAPLGTNVRVICPGKNRDLSVVQVKEVCEIIDEYINLSERSPSKDGIFR
ncbi:MAG TPA: glycosyltransferase family 9 protein [Candidatus Omnitrophota bacterium]|nr:glycosyltransferase family 9 protein [Candidatus Omnitrophota bacterium]HPS19554.1 glycosyltransferase family 9 protein [Candidatus Omnitrophota bacterium]